MQESARVGRRAFVRAGAWAAATLLLGRRLFGQPDIAVASRVGSRDAVRSTVPGTGGWRGPDDEMTDAVKQMLKARFGDRPIRPGHVQLDIPLNAPDGRTVPVILDTDLPSSPTWYVSVYHLIVDHNPDVHVAGFHLTPACSGGFVETRIKMRRTSYVRAIAEMNDGALWSAAVKVFVGLNGCG